MVRFALLGHSGCYNRGCEAILRCTMSLILEEVTDAQFNVVSYFPGTDRGPLREFIDRGLMRLSEPTQNYLSPKSPRGILDRLQRLSVPGFPSRVTYVNRDLIRHASIVMSIGGDTFTDDFWSPRPYFRDLRYCAAMGKKTVIWAASIGPFHGAKAEKEYAAALRNVSLITVRDSESENYLRSIEVVENVVRVADPAFTLTPQPVQNDPIDGDGKIIGFGLSALATSAYANNKAYEDAFVSLGNRLLEASHVTLLLIPHVTGNPTQAGDDEAVCKAVHARLSDSARAIIANSSLTAGQMKYLIGRCDCFIGSRTHSTIAAFSSLVPTISVGSTQKVYGINRDLFGHTEYVLPVEEVNAQTLEQKFDHLIATATEARASLTGAIPRHQAMARNGAKALRDRLGSS